jgi:hypothetical protein
MTKAELEFEVIYSDEDLIELQVKGSNGGYAGQAAMYIGFDEIPNMVKALNKFGSNPEDEYIVELGTFDKYAAGGGALLKFKSSRTGIIIISVKLENDEKRSTGYSGRVEFDIYVEPNAIDIFTPILENIAIFKTGNAILSGLTKR